MFKKEINIENREEMIQFLRNHFRYFTANRWNKMTSYANNMKIHNLDIASETKDKLYDLLDVEEVYDRFSNLVEDFAVNHSYEWQVGWNGRSSGYLVLYSGSRKKLYYKSRCKSCGQLNYKSVAESGCKCGRCGKQTRENLVRPIYQPYVAWKSIDQDEGFEDWETTELQERVRTVMDFDQLCDDIIAEAVYLAEEYKVEEEIYYIEKTRKVLSQSVPE